MNLIWEVEPQIESSTRLSSTQSSWALTAIIPLRDANLTIRTKEESPELVNEDPYGRGMVDQDQAADAGYLDHLMDRRAYLAHLIG